MRPPASAPSLVIDRSWKASRMSGRPQRYALPRREGRPGKPASQGEAWRSPAKRNLNTIVTSLYDALNIWLAFKPTTFNVCAFWMAARTVAALIMSGAVFFSSKELYKSIIRGFSQGLQAGPCTGTPSHERRLPVSHPVFADGHIAISRPERVLFRPGGVNLRGFLCGVLMYASAQPLDFLARTKNPSFPNRKLLVSYKVKFSYVHHGFRMETSYIVASY
jgi:hypothetical protein